MYKSIRKELHGSLSGKILDVSSSGSFTSMIDADNSEVTETSYPEVDMQSLPFDEGSFDVVISDQVIEHLENPQKAIDESYRVLKKGGMAIHTSCFINSIHEPTPDYWRFTLKALEYLCRDFSEIIVSQGWGNRIAILICFYFKKLRFLKIKDTGLSLLRKIAEYNEPGFSIVTWIIAKK
ncbi:class I SAM-dependent methyltransferase [Planctomycetota bacterium]